jgi:hypothetical protein
MGTNFETKSRNMLHDATRYCESLNEGTFFRRVKDAFFALFVDVVQ